MSTLAPAPVPGEALRVVCPALHPPSMRGAARCKIEISARCRYPGSRCDAGAPVQPALVECVASTVLGAEGRHPASSLAVLTWGTGVVLGTDGAGVREAGTGTPLPRPQKALMFSPAG